MSGSVSANLHFLRSQKVFVTKMTPQRAMTVHKYSSYKTCYDRCANGTKDIPLKLLNTEIFSPNTKEVGQNCEMSVGNATEFWP